MTSRAELRELLHAPRIDVASIASLFEKSRPADRVALMESVGGRDQARLWDAAQRGKVRIEEMVPRRIPALVPVTFHGKNSLPAFTRFEKRFCRPNVARDELWGFNYQPVRWLVPLTGPGYFVASDSDEPMGSVAIDYRRLPTSRPEGWPEIRDNDWRLSRFIYRGMVDYLRRISEHVLIGRATRDGKPLPNYFLLCREDPEERP
jgi:hypothetical protein